MNWKARYKESYEAWQLTAYPASSRDFGVLSTKYPKVETHNGLINFMLSFLKWNNHRATRINNQGRIISGIEPGEAGGYFKTIKRIQSTTRNGTADVSATIKGRAVMLDAKVGMDKPSIAQLEEQELERASGGVYEFIHTPEEMITWYDAFILSLK
jgi:hypothetical protein